VIVVASAGNDNLDADSHTPGGSVPVAITVSAITDTDGKCGGAGSAVQIQGKHPFQGRFVTNPDDFFSSDSNFGSVVDLAAPGTNILSTDNRGSYSLDGGTSIAASHVAGAAALYKSLQPSANPFQVDAFLKSVSTQSPPTGNPLVPCDGAGRGYFDDKYTSAYVFTDKIKEPLLHMDGIK
jgi:subtilisin